MSLIRRDYSDVGKDPAIQRGTAREVLMQMRRSLTVERAQENTADAGKVSATPATGYHEVRAHYVQMNRRHRVGDIGWVPENFELARLKLNQNHWVYAREGGPAMSEAEKVPQRRFTALPGIHWNTDLQRTTAAEAEKSGFSARSIGRAGGRPPPPARERLATMVSRTQGGSPSRMRSSPVIVAKALGTKRGGGGNSPS